MSDDNVQRGPSWEVVIERGKIHEFAKATHSKSKAFREEHPVAPPTFLMTASNWAPRGAKIELGFDWTRVVHGEQEFTFFGPPPRAGDVLHASEYVAERYEKTSRSGGTMRFAVVVTEYRGADEGVVAQARCTVIERAPLKGAFT
jgi:hypothetical protein